MFLIINQDCVLHVSNSGTAACSYKLVATPIEVESNRVERESPQGNNKANIRIIFVNPTHASAVNFNSVFSSNA